MKTCSNCGHTQEAGNFCGKCGSNLNETVPEQQQITPEDNQVNHGQTAGQRSANEVLGKVKVESSQYTSYFLDKLKQPSKHFFNADSFFKQNIISIAVYFVLFSILIATTLSKMGYESDFGFYQLPSKTSIVFKADLFLLALMAFGMLSAFTAVKLFGPETSVKTIVSQCASFLTVPIIALLLTIFAVLAEWPLMAFILLSTSLVLVMLVIPMYVVLLNVNRQSKKVDRFYAYLFTMAFIMILNYLLYRILLESALSGIFGNSYW